MFASVQLDSLLSICQRLYSLIQTPVTGHRYAGQERDNVVTKMAPVRNRSGQSGSRKTILVADIGGTNARFALATSGGHELSQSMSLPTAEYPGLIEAVRAYLDQIVGNRPSSACIAVACPVWGDAIFLTNNHWSFSVEEVRQTFALERLLVVNDFRVLAAGVPFLAADEKIQIGHGDPVLGRPVSVIGPGTGLGVATIVLHDGSNVVIDGEGGHVGFAPGNEREIEILRVLSRQYGRVSTERILSGYGLVALHKALGEIDGAGPGPDLQAADIVERAKSKSCARSMESINIFFGILGSFAGDTALTMSSQGGVYIGGGIVPRMSDLLERSPFRERFEAKGRISSFIKNVPTYLITADYVALAGAASLMQDEA